MKSDVPRAEWDSLGGAEELGEHWLQQQAEGLLASAWERIISDYGFDLSWKYEMDHRERINRELGAMECVKNLLGPVAVHALNEKESALKHAYNSRVTECKAAYLHLEGEHYGPS